MDFNSIELLNFYKYLVEKEQEISKKLEPYYEKLKAREKACMNTYGIETPQDKVFFSEIVSIENLKKIVESSDNFQELQKQVEDKTKTCQNENIDEFQRQRRILLNYLYSIQTTDEDINLKSKSHK